MGTSAPKDPTLQTRNGHANVGKLDHQSGRSRKCERSIGGLGMIGPSLNRDFVLKNGGSKQKMFRSGRTRMDKVFLNKGDGTGWGPQSIAFSCLKEVAKFYGFGRCNYT